jgi:chromate reductase
MPHPRRVAGLVGSLRKESLNLKMARALAGLAPEGMSLQIIPISDLPLYDEDLETEAPPPAWTRFRDEVRTADALLFVTPEYNRSIPGALKNALDVGSRPYGQAVFAKKPGAVISVSPGAIGGFGANHHLRQCLVFLDVPAMAQPEAYVGGAAKLFDDGGEIANDATRDFLRGFMTAFGAWAERNAPPPPAT